MMGMKQVFIIPTRGEALERFYSKTDPRDVWAVYTRTREVRPFWVETGPVTRTLVGRVIAEKKAKAAVQLQTGEEVVRVDYDP